jgi:hypothetical protein
MKPKKAATSANQCLAFGCKDVRRCRLEREIGSKTCHIHRSYYVDWVKRFPTDVSFLDLTERKREEYHFQINGGHVVIPEWYVKAITPFTMSYFTIIMNGTHYSPMLNVRTFANYIHKIYHNYPTSEVYAKLKGFMKDAESVLFILDGLIHEVLTTLPSSWMIDDSDTLATFSYARLKELTNGSLWRQIMFATQDIHQCFETNRISFEEYLLVKPEYATVYNEFFSEKNIHEFCQSLQRHHITFIKERCAVYKEELVATAWHPNRLERWLDQGLITLEGLDEL